MEKNYLIEEEIPFLRGLKALYLYHRLSYSYYVFTVAPDLRKGRGIILDGEKHHIDIICNNMFAKVHGKLSLIYSVDQNVITLHSIEPNNVLQSLYSKSFETYKGVPILSPKDKFKVDLLERIYRK